MTEDLALAGEGGLRLDLPGRVALVEEGVTVVLGLSGAGKTSLLRAVMGLEPLARGRVLFDGASWSEVAVERRGLGWSPQRPRLLPQMTVAENVGFGAPGADVARALDAVGAVALTGRDAASLSGGEAQRVSLARAIARAPRLALLDEPFAAIDRPSLARLRADVATALKHLGAAALVVTHDPEDVWAIADGLVVLSRGRVLQSGAAREVLARPATPEVARLVGYDNVVEEGDGGGFAAPMSAVRFTKWTSSDLRWAVLDRVSPAGPGPRAWARAPGGEELVAAEVDASLAPGERCAVRVDESRAARFGEG